MKRSAILAALLVMVANVWGQFSEPDRTLNLKGLQFESIRVSGNSLFLSVTGQPPVFNSVPNRQPVPLTKRPPSELRQKVQVLLGRDVVGLARISAFSRDVLPTSTVTNAPKMTLTSISLVFDTLEQAARAAEGLRSPDVTPNPLSPSRDKR
jgi:hypothetical protein